MFRRKGNPPPASTHQRWSQHTGVSWRQQRGQWEAYCHYDGKKHHLGFFDDEREAAAAYRAAREKYGAKSSKRSSKYKGVSWNKRERKWTAQIKADGKQQQLVTPGKFDVVRLLHADDSRLSMFAYPNRSHSIREGKNTTRHLRRMMTRFLLEKLPAGGR